MKVFGKRGAKEGEISNPCSLSADAAGNIFVTTQSPARILRFDLQGNFIAELKIGDKLFGRLTHPAAIAADLRGNVYLIEAEQRIICKLATPDGQAVSVAR